MQFVRRLALVLFLTLAVCGQGLAEDGPKKPAKEDKCPVCGMFVAKYPDWLAEITWGDGKTVFFDGPKDMFRYYHDLAKYEPGRHPADIAGVYVTEYYNATSIPAKGAFFVLGSDVFGPMGHELIPLATEQEAKDFLADHKGRRVLTFDEVTDAVLAGLD